MRIKTVIDGKEVKGYWNGKAYRSKLGEDYIRIYIDGKEYNIKRDEFKYEEILTEKQKKYAGKIKEEFLETLKREKANEEIVKYFESKPLKYFLNNQLALSRILARVKVDEKLLLSLIKGEVPYEPVEDYSDVDTEKAERALFNSLIYFVKHYVLGSPGEEVVVYLLKDNQFLVDLDGVFIKVDENGNCKELWREEALKLRKEANRLIFQLKKPEETEEEDFNPEP